MIPSIYIFTKYLLKYIGMFTDKSFNATFGVTNKLIDYFTPNENEAEFYTGIKINDERDARESAKKLLNMGIKNVIITLGEKGLFYSNGIDEIYIEANKVKAIDTTGAGDAFNGGFSFALLNGKKIKDCLEFANKVAGLSTTKLGAGDSMPALCELNKL